MTIKEDIEIMGVPCNYTGKDEPVPVAQSKIRRIKERARAIINTLAFSLPISLISFLIFFVVSRINMGQSTTSMQRATPWEQYYGRKINYRTNLKAVFGDYVQAHRNNIDNTMKSRADGCLALYDTGNVEGTWYCDNLSTDRVIRRNRFEILQMPQTLIDHLNNMAQRDLKIGLDAVLLTEIGENRVALDEGVIENDYQVMRENMEMWRENYNKTHQNEDVYDPVGPDQYTSEDQEHISEIAETENNIKPLFKSESIDIDDSDSENRKSVEKDSLPNDRETTYAPRREGLRANRSKPGRWKCLMLDHLSFI